MFRIVSFSDDKFEGKGSHFLLRCFSYLFGCVCVFVQINFLKSKVEAAPVINLTDIRKKASSCIPLYSLNHCIINN